MWKSLGESPAARVIRAAQKPIAHIGVAWRWKSDVHAPLQEGFEETRSLARAIDTGIVVVADHDHRSTVCEPRMGLKEFTEVESRRGAEARGGTADSKVT